MKLFECLLLLCAFLCVVPTTNAQEFFTFLGKSGSYLESQKGSADSRTHTGRMTVYKYENGEENLVFGISNGRVITAIKSIYSSSLSKAKNNTSVQILYYLAKGFSKQGTDSGMTILKKGNRVLTIGYMSNNDGSYSVIVSAM